MPPSNKYISPSDKYISPAKDGTTQDISARDQPTLNLQKSVAPNLPNFVFP